MVMKAIFITALSVVFTALLSTTAISAPVPVLSDFGLERRLSDSASQRFSNLWDIYADAGPADRAVLSSWIDAEMEEVLQSAENTVVQSLTGTSESIFVTRAEHLEFVVKSLDNPSYGLGEHYAYQISEKMGLELVPPTRVELSASGESRMAQLYIRDSITTEGTPFYRDIYTIRPLFDDIIDNVDRVEENVLITAEGHRVYIDHGRSFGPVEQMYLPELGQESYMDFFDSPEKWEKFNSISEDDWEAFFRDNPLVSNGQAERLPEESIEHFII